MGITSLISLSLRQWSPPGAILHPRGHLAMSGDIFDCHAGEEGATGI